MQLRLLHQDQIDDVRKASTTEIWIDPECGEDVMSEALTPAPVPAPTPKPLIRETVTTRPPIMLTSLKGKWKHAQQLIQNGKATLGHMFAKACTGHALETEKALLLVDDVSNSLAHNSYALITLACLKNEDDYIYLHSFAVCALMVALIKALGLPEDETREYGLGGLVHDIGKPTIPHTLPDKSTASAEDELALLQTYAVDGHRLLQGTGQFSEIAHEICLYHRERIDGNDYPDVQKVGGISLQAKMGAICDAYDTLMSSSPYHHVWSLVQAPECMMARTDARFDRTAFQTFARSVGIYSIDTLVRLCTDRLGVVIHQNNASTLRSDMVVFYSGNTKTRVRSERTSLGKSDDSIVTMEGATTWGLPDGEVSDMRLV